MAQKKFKYVVEVVLTFDQKWPKGEVKDLMVHQLLGPATKITVRSVDLE